MSGLLPDRAQYLRSACAVLETVFAAGNTTWNAVDGITGETEVIGSTNPPAWGAAAAEVLSQVVADHPMILSYLGAAAWRSGAPRRMSDVTSRSKLHRTQAYGELLHPFGAEYQLTILTGRQAAVGWCWTLNRSDRDFTDDERELAVRLQPVLIALDIASGMTSIAGAASEEANRLGLTARELEVLGLVNKGLTAVAIGHVLRISAKTVRKHLQNGYGKLGHDRLMAVTRGRRLGLLPTP